MKLLMSLIICLSSATVFAQTECRPDLKNVSDEVMLSLAEGNQLGKCTATYYGSTYQWTLFLADKKLTAGTNMAQGVAARLLGELAAAGACDVRP